MIKNYLLVAFRNVLKNKAFSFINVLGLSIGMACAILILLWVMHELSYDEFHEKKENIYRVAYERVMDDGSLKKYRRLPFPLGDAIKEEIPEVVDFTRYSRGNRVPVIKDDISFYESTVCYADPSILDIFTFPLVEGDPANLFTDIRSVVITERWAKKYFGDESAIGKQLNWNNWQTFTIRGVVQNIPKNSHINFDLITTFDIWKASWPPSFKWERFVHNIYVELQPGSDIKQTEKKIKDLLCRHIINKDRVNKIILQPLTEIHLTTDIQNDHAKVTDVQYIYIYSLIALLILIIACINYINLTTARSVKRSIEIGIRKTLGAERKKIIGQFITESFLVTCTAYILAMMAVEFFLPTFNLLLGKTLEVTYTNTIFLGIIFLILLITTFIAGGYPAFYLSAVQPVKVLKGVFSSGKKAAVFRKVLVILQFSISVLLLTGTVGIYLQMEYISTKKLGFNKEGVVYLPLKGEIGEKYNQFKKELLKNSSILGVSIKNSIPTDIVRRERVNWEGKKTAAKVVINTEIVGFDYFKAMGIKFIGGRSFSKEHSTDIGNSVIVDENAVKLFGFKEPIGQFIQVSQKPVKIVGVINKTNFLPLHSESEPRIYLLTDKYVDNLWNLYGVVLVKINTREIETAIEKIKLAWNNINPKIPIDMNFLDERYNKLYESEKQTTQTLTYFTFIAVFISCLGLFGLVTFTLEQKRKEIAIRKTFGASDSKLVWGFMKSFSSLVFTAFLIAVGPAYYFLYKWLKSFAYHITPGPELFLGVGIILFSITIFTVGFNSLKATRANPVKNLRDE